jgi:hypothetical protein
MGFKKKKKNTKYHPGEACIVGCVDDERNDLKVVAALTLNRIQVAETVGLREAWRELCIRRYW